MVIFFLPFDFPFMFYSYLMPHTSAECPDCDLYAKLSVVLHFPYVLKTLYYLTELNIMWVISLVVLEVLVVLFWTYWTTSRYFWMFL